MHTGPRCGECRGGGGAIKRLTAAGLNTIQVTGSPHVGLGFSTGPRDYSVGWRLAPDFSFGLKASRRESDTQSAEHAIGFEFAARW